MGQQCSVLTCRHVEHPDGMAEMSRLDSPDPVMYDLMRKSIQATTAMQQSVAVEAAENTSKKARQQRLVGQSHLLYRNTPKSSSSSRDVSSGGKKGLSSSKSEKKMEKRAMESRNGGSGGKNNSSTATKNKNPSGSSELGDASWEITPEENGETSLKCPTRLLIRRRSLRIVEEGGGTHIYAIRYPEDTSKMILSEQAQPMSPVVQQEQCPPRSQKTSSAAAVSATTAASSPTATKTNAASDKDPARTTKNQKKIEPVKADGKDAVKKKSDKSKSDNTATQASKDSPSTKTATSTSDIPAFLTKPETAGEIFSIPCMTTPPKRNVVEWVTVSEEHNIYVADVGLTAEECDEVVATTEQVCRGQYAAYTYAKQTLGCREFPILAHASFNPVHTIVHSIINKFPLEDEKEETAAMSSKTTTKSPSKNANKSNDKGSNSKSGTSDIKKDLSKSKSEEGVEIQRQLQLDDREPHIVKYDVTRKERQKLDMHTDKSEWTFLIALSNGCGVDYEGGGTYFECLDATVHIQRGHALVFPGKLRHCGQKITSGLRFLLVGFLVDKQSTAQPTGKGSSIAKSPLSAKTNEDAATNPKSPMSIAKDTTPVSIVSC